MISRLSFRTTERACMIDATARVREAVAASGIRSGVCHVYVPHTTAGITINEGADPAVVDDIQVHLRQMVPWGAAYQHREGNAAAHIKAVLVGTSTTVFVEEGDLVLGTWQGIFLCEFDGPREREVWVKVVQT